MKLKWVAVVGVALCAAQVSAQEAAELKTQKDKVSYAIGMDLGSQFRKLSVDVDPEVLSRGLKDILSNSKTLLSQEEALSVLTDLQAAAKKKMEEARQTAMEENNKAGAAFLAENKKKEGVVTLASGLQYKILKPGSGPKPTLEDTVKCQYRGTLIDGTEFDSSYKRGEPAIFPVKGVIAGWTEALQLMPEGSKWQLFIPAQLAYGERGASGVIAPDSTLIFEVELVSIKGKS
jgi:FKBP-type peptidyl-prolyl cis-trans isomerase FklB